DLNRSREFYLFNHIGLQYYLPAYLLALIEKPEQISRGVGEDFVEYLAHYSELASTPCDLWNNFTEEQRQVVLEFLVYFTNVVFPTPNQQSRSLSPALRYIEQKHRDRFQKAIDYWKGCM